MRARSPDEIWSQRRRGACILAVGVLIGLCSRAELWFRPHVGADDGEGNLDDGVLFPALVARRPAETPPANGLDTLVLALPPESAARLQRARRTALERGILAPDEKDPVPAWLTLEGRAFPADVRLKGDWTDHLEGRQWSLRIRLRNGAFRGLREFSIQAPRTRDYLWEWLVLESGRREGLLAPRATFVNVVQNGNALGVYFLEEHFARELLESQGRRDGPIVCWDESTLWNTLLREGAVPSKGQVGSASAGTEPAKGVLAAEVRAYDERRGADANLRTLDAALDALKALRALAVETLPGTQPPLALEARAQLRGRTLPDLVDVERLACAHALFSLFQCEHPLAWHNMRFHYDALQARLEPILFDNMAATGAARAPVPWRGVGLVAAFALEPSYYEGVFRHLGRMLAPEWSEELFAALEPELARFELALRAEGSLPAGHGVADMRRRLQAELEFLRQACIPEEPLGFRFGAREAGSDEVELALWSTTRAPVQVEAFRLPSRAPADPGLAAAGLSPAERWLRAGPARRTLAGAVVLPADGSALLFCLPALAQGSASARYRALAAQEARELALE